MGKKSKRTKRKSELKIIFFIILVAAALFIVSTYAWFSTQRNVSITNLSGTVEVAEGLEISLDAKRWFNEIVLGDGEDEMSIIDDAYEGHNNIIPSEMMPVSTLGKMETTTMTDLQFLRGKLSNTKELSDVTAVVSDKSITDSEDLTFGGYIAFDLFLKNSSSMNKTYDELQLNYDSQVKIMESSEKDDNGQPVDKSYTGLQNTVRVGFARYGAGALDAQGGTAAGTADVTEQVVDNILKYTGAKAGGNKVYLTDAAIWEPNSNNHVDTIVSSNNYITWSDSMAMEIFGDSGTAKTPFTNNTQMPTFALNKSSIDKDIDDIYIWNGTETALSEQMVIQTTAKSANDYTVAEGVKNLISTASTSYDKSGIKNFTIPANTICRLRVYVWLEGQDVDCINYASHGGGVTVNIGLVKGEEEGLPKKQS